MTRLTPTFLIKIAGLLLCNAQDASTSMQPNYCARTEVFKMKKQRRTDWFASVKRYHTVRPLSCHPVIKYIHINTTGSCTLHALGLGNAKSNHARSISAVAEKPHSAHFTSNELRNTALK
jgi:hypothetical protein